MATKGKGRFHYVERCVCLVCGGDFDPFEGGPLGPAGGHREGCPVVEKERQGIACHTSYREFSERREGIADHKAAD